MTLVRRAFRGKWAGCGIKVWRAMSRGYNDKELGVAVAHYASPLYAGGDGKELPTDRGAIGSRAIVGGRGPSGSRVCRRGVRLGCVCAVSIVGGRWVEEG